MRQILIVDRNPSALDSLVMALRQGGFDVTTASRIDRVPDALPQAGIDLVLLDVGSPVMQGIAVRENLRQQFGTPSPLVLFMVDKADEERVHSMLGGSFDYITRPFDPVDVVACVKSYLPDLPADLDLNPLTEMPGLLRVEQELSSRISKRKPFALLDIDISNLRPFRTAYGSLRANHAIRLLARIIDDASRIFGAEDDVVAHVSDDNFYAITLPERAQALCHRITSRFDDKVRDLYHQNDLLRGYLECEYPLGYNAHYPLMTLAIGVTTSDNRGANDHLQVRRSASEVQALSKTAPSSAFRFDERRDDLTFDGALARLGRQGRPLAMIRRTPQSQWEREKSHFIYFVTNQLRLPVTIVQSTLDYVVQATEFTSPIEPKQYLAVLQKHARHLSDSVSQLATLYRLSEGITSVRPSAIDVDRVLKEVLEFVGEVIAAKDISLELHKAANVNGITVDENILCQIIIYTLYSISEYASPGTSIRVDLATSELAATITISVQGAPLAKHDLVKAFRSFYRPRDAAASSYDSLGIGFHLARQSLSSLGGVMTVHQGESLDIAIQLPRMWQSVEGRVASIHRVVEAARSLASGELTQISATLGSRPPVPDAALASLEKVGPLIDRIASEADRALYLADETLAHLVMERQRAIALDAGFLTFAEAMIEMVERRDAYYAGHSKRVAEEALLLGRSLDIPEGELRNLYYAALLHDVGMLGVPDKITAKPGHLSDDECLTLRQHPLIGSRSLGTVDTFGPIIQPILHHHERYDGSGYPLGLKGERIPLAARILSVADAFDALTSSRPYRPAVLPSVARDRIIAEAGAQFDPRVVAAFVKAHREIDTSGDGAKNA